MAERTDATLLDLVGSASVTGVVEISSRVRDFQSLVDVVEVTLVEDDDEDAALDKIGNASQGICKVSEREPDPISCPLMALQARGINDEDPSEAVTKPASNPSPLKKEALLGACYSSADPHSDQSKAVQSENKGTPLNLMNSEAQSEPLMDSCMLTAQKQGETMAKNLAGLSGLELAQKKAVEEVTSMEQMAQELTPLAASVSILDKKGGQVNGEEKDQADGPCKELVSESQDEFEVHDVEEEEVTRGVQHKSSSEGSHISQGASPRCRVQYSREMFPEGSQKSSSNHHSYSKYNTVSYRKIRKGNTKQRIDEFESIMHL